jgi:hypothetical protein
MEAITNLVNRIIASIDLCGIPEKEAVAEYTDQLATGDCNSLYSFLRYDGKHELAKEVRKYRRKSA